MVLPIRLTSLEGLDLANVVIWVTWTYGRETQKYEEGVTKRKVDWYVLHKGMLFPCVENEVHSVSELVMSMWNVHTDITDSFVHGSIDLSNIPMKYTDGFHMEWMMVLR